MFLLAMEFVDNAIVLLLRKIKDYHTILIGLLSREYRDRVQSKKRHCMQNLHLATLDMHDVTRDGGMANGRDIDDQRIDLSMERHKNRIVAAV